MKENLTINKMENRKTLKLVKKICSFGERQDKNISNAMKFIENYIQINKVSYTINEYAVKVPYFKKFWLKVDGKSIECAPSGLKSGKITNKFLISNLLEEEINKPNINFNPYCEEISRMNFYSAPALTIKRKDTNKIRNAKNIEGILVVEEKKETGKQILVGNTTNPRKIVFTHVDSIGGEGAIYNAVSNALLLNYIVKNKESCKESYKENLYAFDPCEELSLNDNKYWCYGFRVFEKKHTKILNDCKKIIVLDGIGINTKISKEKKDIDSTFNVDNKKLFSKITVFIEPTKPYLKWGHSKLDTISHINKKDITKMEKIISKKLK